MNFYDSKILELIRLLKQIGEVKTYQEIYNIIGITKYKINEVKNGRQHFTSEQIQKVCEYYNVNANWIFGLENNIFRK